jgi:tetratricopeptide (TPR) repeat protein
MHLIYILVVCLLCALGSMSACASSDGGSDKSTAVKHLTLEGEAYMKNGSYQDAVRALSEALQLDPQAKSVLLSRGRCYAQLQQYDKALADLDAALKLGENTGELHLVRGFVLAQTGLAEKAVDEFNLSIEANPRSPEALNFRGHAYLEIKQPDKALRDFDAALVYKPDDGDSYYNRALIYLDRNEVDKALADLEAARSHGISAPWLGYAIGRIYEDKGNLTAALQNYSSANLGDKDQDAADLYMRKAFLLLCLGGSEAKSADESLSRFFKITGSSAFSEKEPNAALATIWKALSEKEDQQPSQSAETLQAAIREVGAQDTWPKPIMQYLAGQITAEQLLSLASRDDDKLAQAHCYIGVSLALDGKSEAPSQFEWVLSHASKDTYSYKLASARKEHFQQNIGYALNRAIWDKNLSRLTTLLANGANPNWGAPLVDAVIHENSDAVHVLLDKGADVNSKLEDGRTALYFAAMHSKDLVQLLLAKNADVNLSDSYGISPLMNAAGDGNVEAVKLLLAHGASVNQKVIDTKVDPAGGQVIADKGATALSIAKKRMQFGTTPKAQEIVTLLERAGAKK